MGWNYLDAARIEDFKAVLAVAPDGPAIAAVKYRAWLTYNVVPGERAGRPAADRRPVRLGDPDRRLPARAPARPARVGRLGVGARRRDAMADRHAPRRAARRSARSSSTRRRCDRCSVPHSRMLSIFIGPELLVDAGRRDEARAAIAEGRRLALADGSLSPLAAELVRGGEAGAAAREGPGARAGRARPRGERARTCAGSRGRPSMFDTLYGLALLLAGRGRAGAARGCARRWRRCRRATASSSCPTAAVYLAEAEWRAGNEDAADRAADIALEAAQRQGSNHILMQALADLPAVLSRRLDAEPSADSTWHQLGRALMAQGVRLTAEPGRVDPLPRLRRALARGRRRAPAHRGSPRATSCSRTC